MYSMKSPALLLLAAAALAGCAADFAAIDRSFTTRWLYAPHYAAKCEPAARGALLDLGYVPASSPEDFPLELSWAYGYGSQPGTLAVAHNSTHQIEMFAASPLWSDDRAGCAFVYAVVTHEGLHILGYEHTDTPNDIMLPALNLGGETTRRMPFGQLLSERPHFPKEVEQ